MHVEQEPKELTAFQQMVYDYIFKYTCKNGFQPRREDIIAHFKMKSRNSAFEYIRALSKKGWIGEGGHRSVVFLFKPDGTPFEGFVPK